MGAKPQFTAKDKLNAAHFRGAFIVAGLVGLATQSPTAFAAALAAALAVTVVISLMSGSIRK